MKGRLPPLHSRAWGRLPTSAGTPQPGEEGRMRNGDLELGGRGHPAELPGHLGTCLSLVVLAVLLALTPTLAPKSLLGFWGEGTS